MQDSQQVKRTRQRSREHPKIPVPQCLDYAKVVREYGGLMSVADYATALGYKSYTTGAVIPKISNPPYYGLLSREGDTLRTTDLLDRLVTPVTEEEEQSAKLEAFRHVAIYAELIELIGKSGTKQDRVVENMAQRRLGIQPGAAKEFVDVFVQSAEWAGLAQRIDDGSFELRAEPAPTSISADTPAGESETAATGQPPSAPQEAGLQPPRRAATRAMDLHVHIHFGRGESGEDMGDKIKALLMKIGALEEQAQ